MLYFVLLSALHLFFILDGIHSEKPPTVTSSFYAVGEIVTSNQDGSIETTVFEESFDEQNRLTAAEFLSTGLRIRINEDLSLKKTFVILEGMLKDSDNANCQEADSTAWIDMNIEPHLKEFEVVKGQIVLPIRQLLLLQDKSLVDQFKEITYRGVSAHMWLYETSSGTKISAYWSIGEWVSPSKYHAVPLGFKIDRTSTSGGSVSYINVMNFQHDRVESSLFEPVRGVYCEGKLEDLYPFPKEVRELVEFSYSMEVVLQGSESITTVDTWIDLPKRIIRTDYDPYGRDADDHHTFTEIVSLKQGAKYEIIQEVDEGCLVDPVTTNSDMQILFDYTSDSKWTGEGFFGLDKTKYIYVGDTMERGIPCKLYHGKREDFPYGSTGFATLWEWCTTDQLKSGTERVFPVVSLNIYFKQVNESVKTKPSEIVPGSKLTYHFYNAQHLFEASHLLTSVFDLQNCFSAENKTDRVLTVQVNKQREAIQGLVHDITFVYKWWNVLQEKSTLKEESLRLGNVRLRIGTTGPLYVFFTLLNSHYDLPPEVYAKELPLSDVLVKLEQAVNAAEVKISQDINGETVTLVAEKMEAIARLSSAAKTRLLSPESNKINSLTKNDPIAVHFSPQISSQPKSQVIENGWALWIVLGVGAAMLVSGVGLGIFSGASGIVLKRKYASTN